MCSSHPSIHETLWNTTEPNKNFKLFFQRSDLNTYTSKPPTPSWNNNVMEP